MFRVILLAIGVACCGVAPVHAATFGYDVIYGSELGCIHADGGDGSDGWAVLTAEGIERYESSCEFVSLTVGRYGDHFANAICHSEGYTYPEMFTMISTWDGKGLEVVSSEDRFGEPEVFSRCKVK